MKLRWHIVSHVTQQAVGVRLPVSDPHFSLKTSIATGKTFHTAHLHSYIGMLFAVLIHILQIS